MRGEAQFRSDKLAVLIDADNTSADVIEPLLREITKFGAAYLKRVYGDWTSPQMSKWKKALNDFAIVPIQQFSYTSGKNSTDSALIIDAMDLLYTDQFDGFCLVSSDSDFTRLVHRIRQEGVSVYGFGKQQTPKPFVAACDRFVYTELLQSPEAASPEKISAQSGSDKGATPERSPNLATEERLLSILKDAYEAIVSDDGTANLGALGQQLQKLDPSFDTRAYGYKKLSQLIKATSIFDIKDNEIRLNF